MPFYMFKVKEEYLTVEAPNFEEALRKVKGMGEEPGRPEDKDDSEGDPILSAVTAKALLCRYG